MNVDLVRTGLEHSWAWFTLHANQRLQTVNFFLVAVTFLTAAFVTAAKEEMDYLAMAVAVIGILISYYFYRMECRVRSILKASERAIMPLQSLLATALEIDSLRIVELVEDDQPGEWKYSKVFRYLFATFGIAFSIGLLYSARLLNMPSPVDRNTVIQLLIALFAMLFGRSLLTSHSTASDASASNKSHANSVSAAGFTSIGVGLGLLVYVVVARL